MDTFVQRGLCHWAAITQIVDQSKEIPYILEYLGGLEVRILRPATLVTAAVLVRCGVLVRRHGNWRGSFPTRTHGETVRPGGAAVVAARAWRRVGRQREACCGMLRVGPTGTGGRGGGGGSAVGRAGEGLRVVEARLPRLRHEAAAPERWRVQCRTSTPQTPRNGRCPTLRPFQRCSAGSSFHSFSQTTLSSVSDFMD